MVLMKPREQDAFFRKAHKKWISMMKSRVHKLQLEDLRPGMTVYVPDAKFYVGDTHTIGTNATGIVESIDIKNGRGPHIKWIMCSINYGPVKLLPTPQGCHYGLDYSHDGKPKMNLSDWVHK